MQATAWYCGLEVKAKSFQSDKRAYYRSLQTRIHSEVFSKFPLDLLLWYGCPQVCMGTYSLITNHLKKPLREATFSQVVAAVVVTSAISLPICTVGGYFTRWFYVTDRVRSKSIREENYEKHWEGEFDRKCTWPALYKHAEKHRFMSEFFCPQSGKLMRCAVIAPDGKVYDLLSMSNFLQSYNKGTHAYSISCDSLQERDPFPLTDCVPAYCKQLRLYRCLVNFIDQKALEEDRLHKRIRSSLGRIKRQLETAIDRLYEWAIVGQMEGKYHRSCLRKQSSKRAPDWCVEEEFFQWVDQCNKDKPRFYPKGYAQQLLATWRVVRKESTGGQAD